MQGIFNNALSLALVFALEGARQASSQDSLISYQMRHCVTDDLIEKNQGQITYVSGREPLPPTRLSVLWYHSCTWALRGVTGDGEKQR